MKCSEFHELAAAYALDALGEDERLACVHHLEAEAPHEGCEALAARYERTVDAMSALHGKSAPSPSVWRAIEARIAPRRIQWREPTAWALAAAALLGIVWMRERGVDGAQRAERQLHQSEQAHTSTSEKLAQEELARRECELALELLTRRATLERDAVSLLENPATKLTPMLPAGAQPYRATALYNPASKRALIISSTISEVKGQDFQLWVIAAGETAPRPAGFLRFDASGVALGEFNPALLGDKPPAAFAVSLEPLGGRPTPTEVVLLGKLQG
ncbi:MAG: anti-sigma factor [Polyangiales bacterium]